MQPSFLAAIDIGTNSFHLLIVKVLKNDFEVVYRERQILRLRENSNSNNHIISHQKISEAIQLLSQFKHHCEKYGAQIHAVATSAIRDAANKDEVQGKILESTGIKINILSGDQEAELVYKSAFYKKEAKDKNVLVFDLGGGSTEFILGCNQKILFKTSLQIGAVRFMQKYSKDYLLSEDKVQLMKAEVKTMLSNTRNTIAKIGYDFCLGIGGTITSLSWLIDRYIYKHEHKFTILHDYKISRNDFNLIQQVILSQNSIEERKQIPGMEPKRADIIPAGMIIVNEIFAAFNLENIIAPGYSIKEGVIINTIQHFSGG